MRHLSKLAVAVALLCVPAQLAQAAKTTTTGPAIKWGRSISFEDPKKSGAFDAVSCAINNLTTKDFGKQLCVAADETGNIWWSTSPWKARAFWKRVTIDKAKGASLTGISCPTTSFCAVVDNEGNVILSKDPTGGARFWTKPVKADGTQAPGGGPAGLAGISCVSTTECVAVDNVGQVIASVNPFGGATAWTVAALPNSPVLTSISCPRNNLCVIAGSTRFYATNPTGAVNAWHAVGSSEGVLSSISCPSAKGCVAVGYGNSTTELASSTATPSGLSSGWVDSTIDESVPSGNAQLLDSVSCPTIAFCVAVDGADNAVDTTTPLTGTWSTIKPARKKSTSTWSAISCTAKNCIVVDSRGFITSGTVENVKLTLAGAGGGTGTTGTGATTTSTTSTTTTAAGTTTTAAG